MSWVRHAQWLALVLTALVLLLISIVAPGAVSLDAAVEMEKASEMLT